MRRSKPSPRAISCRRGTTPWPRFASRCPPSLLWWISGGKASTRIWSHASCRRGGGSGGTSASCPWSIGTIKWRVRAAADGKPRCRQPGQRCASHLTSTLSPSGSPPKFWRIGKHGPFSGRRPFSGPPRPWKGAMGICHTCTITIGACPGGETRCGRSCTPLIVALWMARRPRRAFSGGRSRISLKRCSLIWRPCPSRGGENTKSHYVLEVIKCPALSGYPDF